MKTKYVIGLLAAFLLIVVLLTAGYQISYRHVMDRQAAAAEEEAATESIAAEGEAVKDEKNEEGGYWLSQLQGYVVVYLNDRTTIYEMTDILLTDLPEEVQQEIASGKSVSTTEKLYAFLENYSS